MQFPLQALAFLTNMREERNSASPSAAQMTITTEEKLDIISRLVKKMSELWTYAIMLRLAHGSVCTIHDNADRIR